MPDRPARLRTSHAGSLPRPAQLAGLLDIRDSGESFSQDAFEKAVRDAVSFCVDKQSEAAIDIVSDGEMSKISHSTYVRHRLSGFSGDSIELGTIGDLRDYPGFAARYAPPRAVIPACTGPIEYTGLRECERDIANIQRALASKPEHQGFLSAASPGIIANSLQNRFYSTYEDYLFAISEAMAQEYRAICAAGLALQIDCPDLAMNRHMRFAENDLHIFLDNVALHVEALNRSVQGLPQERIRIHVCWGNYEGPHHRDVPLQDIITLIYSARPTGLTIAAGNPRHSHEWKVFREHRLPADKILYAGVIDTTTNFIEHEEVIADRLCRFADVVDPECLVAMTDCGFAPFASFHCVDAEIVWTKLAALAAGARLASLRVFS